MKPLLRFVSQHFIRPDGSVDEEAWQVRLVQNQLEDGVSFLSRCERCQNQNSRKLNQLSKRGGTWYCVDHADLSKAGLIVDDLDACHVVAFYKTKHSDIPFGVRAILCKLATPCSSEFIEC